MLQIYDSYIKEKLCTENKDMQGHIWTNALPQFQVSKQFLKQKTQNNETENIRRI